VADLDADGRLDITVSQPWDETNVLFGRCR
jgi:hypothetical protein